MTAGIISKAFYGNTIDAWIVSLSIVLGSVILGKVLFWVFSKSVKKFAGKTKTKLDDLIVDMVEEPVVFAIIVAGIWYGLARLTFTPAVDIFIYNVFQFLLIINVTWLFVRLVDSIIKEYIVPLVEKSETDLDDQILPIARKGTKTVLWTLGAIVALNNAGYDVTAVIAGLGVGGLALAMAAKDMVSNIFGGFTIFTDKPFKLNDRIKIAGFDGKVKEIGLRSTRIETLEGRLVTMPNAKFASDPVENVSAEPSRKVVQNIGLTYDMSPKQMQLGLDILREIAENSDGTEDKVLTCFTGFGDFSMNLQLIYYISKGADILATQTDINMSILERFTSEGLEMAFPTQTIYTKNH